MQYTTISTTVSYIYTEWDYYGYQGNWSDENRHKCWEKNRQEVLKKVEKQLETAPNYSDRCYSMPKTMTSVRVIVYPNSIALHPKELKFKATVLLIGCNINADALIYKVVQMVNARGLRFHLYERNMVRYYSVYPLHVYEHKSAKPEVTAANPELPVINFQLSRLKCTTPNCNLKVNSKSELMNRIVEQINNLMQVGFSDHTYVYRSSSLRLILSKNYILKQTNNNGLRKPLLFRTQCILGDGGNLGQQFSVIKSLIEKAGIEIDYFSYGSSPSSMKKTLKYYERPYSRREPTFKKIELS